MAGATISRNNTLPNSSNKSDFHDLVDKATISLDLSTISEVVAMSSKTFKTSKGADVASGTSISLGEDGNYFDITGTTNIQTITIKQAGTIVALQFDGALNLIDSTGNLKVGGSNLSVSAGDNVVLVSDGTNWHLAGSSQSTTTQNPQSLDVVTSETTVCTSSVAEETLWTYSVPAGTIGSDALLRGKIMARHFNNSGGAVVLTLRLKYGSTTVVSLTHSRTSSATANDYEIEFFLKGDGSTSSQEGRVASCMAQYGSSVNRAYVSQIGTSSEDSTGTLNISVTLQSDTNDGNISIIRKMATLELLSAI